MLQIPVRNKLNIHVIGAGGTGGYAIENLARLFAGDENKHTIHIYDGDVIEPKNLKRQNFTFSEIDQNKANALVARLNDTIHQAPELVAHDTYITSAEELMIDMISTLDTDTETLVVIMALDNVASRRTVNEAIMDHLPQAGIPVIAIDSGNDDLGGQVVLYANASIKYQHPINGMSVGMLPTMLQLYPEIDRIEDTNPGIDMSCEDNAESQPQSMMCNVRNGDVIANTLYQIYANKTISGNVWTSNSLTGVTNSTFSGFHREVTD